MIFSFEKYVVVSFRSRHGILGDYVIGNEEAKINHQRMRAICHINKTN